MKLLIQIMKKSTNKFFNPDQISSGIKTFFILAGLAPNSHVRFFFEDLIEFFFGDFFCFIFF